MRRVNGWGVFLDLALDGGAFEAGAFGGLGLAPVEACDGRSTAKRVDRCPFGKGARGS